MVVKADITIDIDKQIGNLQNLTNLYNARVGDTTPLTIQWYKNGLPLDCTGLRAFIVGHVGDGTYNQETDKIDFPPDSSLVEASDDGSGTLSSGLTTLLIPKQMWQKSGIFSGYVGLKSSNGAVYTGKNIWFKVLGNVLESGIEINYFVQDFEKAISQANGRINQALQDLKSKYDQEVKAHSDALLDDTTQLRKLAASVGEMMAQIDANNIVKKTDYDKDIAEIKSSISQRLAQINPNPIGVANADYLKKNYPNGADGIFIAADTGHKWIYIGSSWTDCGNYQAIGIDSALTDPLRAAQLIDENNIAQNSRSIDNNSSKIFQNTKKINENLTRIQEVEGAGHFTLIYLTDQNGQYITDQAGNRIVGNKWLPLVDKTLTQSDLPADAKAVGDAISSEIKNATEFRPEKYGIPVLYLWGDNILSLKDKSKTLKNEVTYKFPLYHVQGTVSKFKVQGASSAGLPKKNYTLNLDQDFEAFPGFGKQHKYVIKANYLDASQALNVVNAKLWGKMRSTHYQASDALQDDKGNYLVDNNGNHIIAETDPQLSIGGNYGAVDGFPIAVYINDQYWGLYSFNIPKDDWMAKMPSKAGYAIVDTVWAPQGALQKETNFKDQMELQFCGTKDTQWAQDSINRMIDAVMVHYDKAEDFDTAVSPLVDLDSAYDYYIYSVLVNNDDGLFRNYLLQTFDGKKWYFAAYDLDETFGRTPDFLEHTLADSDTNDFRDHGVTFENAVGNNRLMYQLWKFHKDEILKRAQDFVKWTMSVALVDTAFVDYVRKIPQIALDEEIKAWPGTPNTSVDNVNRVGRWYMQRIDWFKKRYLDNTQSELVQLKARIENLEHVKVTGK